MPNQCPYSARVFGYVAEQNSCSVARSAAFSRKPRRERSWKASIAELVLAVFLIILCGLLPGRLNAQAVYGSIGGTVVDSSGGIVSGAKVTITDLDRNIVYTTSTDASGNYDQRHLIVGHYRVQVELAGFKTAVSEVDVAVDSRATFDLTLQPGDISQTISVTDVAPLLKTERTDVSTTLTEKQVTQLPTWGRNFSNLLLLTPGAVQFCWGDTSTENPQGGIAVNVNGQMFVGDASVLDGTDNRDFLYGNMLIVPSLDSVVEMKVTSAVPDAEFGQVSAAVITTSTKSGTNEFHGEGLWFRRNDSMEARDPFAQSIPDPITGKYIPATIWDQFGGSFGGPVIKNKAFFFVDYQGTRAKDGGSATARVPTQAERNGDFSVLANATGQNIYNPFDSSGNLLSNPSLRTQFANNMIPASMISTAAQNLLKYIPLPNMNQTDPTLPNYSGGASDVYNGDAITGRADYFYSDTLRFFDRYTFTQFLKQAPGLFGPIAGGPQLNQLGYTGSGDTRPQSNSFGFDKTIKPTLLTDFRFGWYKQRINVNPLADGNFATQAGAVGLNIPTDPLTNNMPHFSIQGQGGFDFGNGLYNNCNCPLIERMQQFQFVNNWTWTKGKHTMKFGADVRRLMNLRVPSDQHRSGEVYFASTLTEGPSGGGIGLASFLLGDVSTFQRYVSSSENAGERQSRLFSFAEDTWRVSPKLTVNFGLRWEIYFPQTVTGTGQGGWLDINTGEMLVAGENGVGLNGNVRNSFTNLAPRLGIAYQFNPKTVVRVGYGRSFDQGMFGTIFGHTVTQNLPVLGTQYMQPTNNWDPVFNLAAGPPMVDPATVLDSQPKGPTGSPLYPNGFRAWVLPQRIIMPTVDAWNATIQREITPTLSIEAAYVGNKGTHIFVGESNWYDINAPTMVGFPNLTTEQRQPYFAKYGWNIPLECMCNTGNNHYNALQIKAEKRFSKGFTILSHYTYSHAKNHDAPDYLYDPNLFYGRPSWQRNNVFVFTGIWDLPFGKGRMFGSSVSTPVNYLIGGWQLSGQMTIMGGTGITPSYQECGSDNDIGVCLPNVVGAISEPKQQNDWFELTAVPLANNGQTSGPWQRPQIATPGNAQRNSIIGPGWFDADASLVKSFPIKERVNTQVRWEVYNLTNHPNLGNPSGCVDCIGGNVITGLNGNATMRRMQVALLFQF
jgi:Carboxypeptidase regulatory-like domain/TonB dependent receptor